MKIFLIILGIIIALFIFLSYMAYRLTFCTSEREKIKNDIYNIPKSKQYGDLKESITALIGEIEKTSHEEVFIKSFDGLNLFAKYYHHKNNAPVQIMVHGYRGRAERDYCGGYRMSKKIGHNALIVDQRSHGMSEGNAISFGINERYDVLSWINYITERFGKNTKIILTGISMGAASVLMASELDLPENVVGIIADCGYTSPKEIIEKVLHDIKLNPKVFYPLIRIGAKIWGGIDIESADAVDALKNCKVPVLFIHGEDDRYVPYEMSIKNYEACASDKKIVTFPNAGHGLSYFADMELYVKTVEEFLEKVTA